jgi:two-component system NtrC family sensor kinase
MNLDHRIDVSSDDEIGDLAASFNGMTEELKRANQAIQEWSATLERKVQQKTAALEKAQSHLVLAEKMSSLGKLSAMVAHEINNPLTGILTYAKVSLRGLERGSDPAVIADVNENLGIIRDEAKRCGGIVKNMLAFSHRTGGQMELEDLAAIVRRSVGLVHHSFEVKGVELSMELPDGETIVSCNADSIQQILIALLINAFEAIGPTPARVRVALQRLPADGMVRLTVADNGSGIPPEILPHVFEPFFTTKETGTGTGLGLAVAYGVVTRHGGWISAESGTEGGTVFTVELPIDGPPEPVSEARTT